MKLTPIRISFKKDHLSEVQTKLMTFKIYGDVTLAIHEMTLGEYVKVFPNLVGIIAISPEIFHSKLYFIRMTHKLDPGSWISERIPDYNVIKMIFDHAIVIPK